MSSIVPSPDNFQMVFMAVRRVHSQSLLRIQQDTQRICMVRLKHVFARSRSSDTRSPKHTASCLDSFSALCPSTPTPGSLSEV